MRVLVVIPAFQEAMNLAFVLQELRRVKAEVEVLVVDDGSTDGSSEVLERLGARYLRLPFQLGVGSALRAGMRFADAHGYQAVVRVDADAQHPADAIGPLLEALSGGNASAAVGSRFMAGDRPRSWRALAQRALSLGLSFWLRHRVTDPTSGLWAFDARAVRFLSRHHPTGYPEPELHLLLSRAGYKVVEAPVRMRPRRAGTSSLTASRMVVAALRVLLALVIVPLRRIGEPARE